MISGKTGSWDRVDLWEGQVIVGYSADDIWEGHVSGCSAYIWPDWKQGIELIHIWEGQVVGYSADNIWEGHVSGYSAHIWQDR